MKTQSLSSKSGIVGAGVVGVGVAIASIAGAGRALAQPEPFVVPVEVAYAPGAPPLNFGRPTIRSIARSGALVARCDSRVTGSVFVVDAPGATPRVLLAPSTPAPGRPELLVTSYAHEAIDAAGVVRARLTLRDAFGTLAETGIVEIAPSGATRLLLWSGNAAPAVFGASIAPLNPPLFAASSDGWLMGIATIAGVGLLPSNNRVQYAVSPAGTASVLVRSGDGVAGWADGAAFSLSQSEPSSSVNGRFAAAFGLGQGLVLADALTANGTAALWTLVTPGAAPTPLLRQNRSVEGMAAPTAIERLDLIAAREDGRCVFVASAASTPGALQVAYASQLRAGGFAHREVLRTGQALVGVP
jgi:hypothetical protein